MNRQRSLIGSPVFQAGPSVRFLGERACTISALLKPQQEPRVVLYSSFHSKNARMLGLLGGKLTPSPLEGSGPFRAQYAGAASRQLSRREWWRWLPAFS